MADTSEVTSAPTDADAGSPAGSDEPPVKPFFERLFDRLREAVLAPFAELGVLSRMLFDTLYWAFRRPFRGRLFIDSLEFVGVGSIFIVSVTGLFLGMVLSLQLVDGFRQFGAETQSGAVTGLGLAREIGPVFAALMVSSRAGSAMTTELGSMRVTQQIAALEVMAVNPVQYLVVPRVFAGAVMVPALTILFNIIGMMGAYAVAVELMGIDPGIFLDRARWLVDFDDVVHGLIKASVFGTVVCLIACRQGFFAGGGAAGVGRATNRSVVHSAIAILALDYVLTSLMIGSGQG